MFGEKTNCISAVKHGGAAVMMWVWFAARGVFYSLTQPYLRPEQLLHIPYEIGLRPCVLGKRIKVQWLSQIPDLNPLKCCDVAKSSDF